MVVAVEDDLNDLRHVSSLRATSLVFSSQASDPVIQLLGSAQLDPSLASVALDPSAALAGNLLAADSAAYFSACLAAWVVHGRQVIVLNLWRRTLES